VLPTSVPPTSTPPTNPGVRVDVGPAAAPGQPVAVSLSLWNVSNLYGLQAQCTVNPAVLAGVGHVGADGFNDGNGFFVDQKYQPDGSWTIAATRLQPNTPISGNAIAFTLNYTVVAAGSTPVNCTVTGVDINGHDVPLEISNGGYNGPVPTPPPATPTITPTPETPTPTPIPPTVQPGQPSIVSGTVNYPGATDHSGITVGLYAPGGTTALVQLKTNANGRYQFVGVPIGTYVLRVSAPQSLVLEHTVTVEADGLSIDLGTDNLPVGDTDDNGAIDVNDASLVGANFGIDGKLVTNADLNRDAIINVRDLVLVGKNYGLTSPVVGGQ
jgi:hypothetical protein